MKLIKGFRSWSLSDAQKIARENPYTFYKPSNNAVSQLAIGDQVKLIFRFKGNDPEAPSAERMWVEITRIDQNKFSGKLDNDPLHIKDLKCGDDVTFRTKHIVDTSTDDPEPNLIENYIARCFVTNRILHGGENVGYLYREEPDRSEDSGWRFMVGDESDEYMDNAENISLVSLGAVLGCDDSFVDLLDSPIDSAYIKNVDTGMFEEIDD